MGSHHFVFTGDGHFCLFISWEDFIFAARHFYKFSVYLAFAFFIWQKQNSKLNSKISMILHQSSPIILKVVLDLASSKSVSQFGQEMHQRDNSGISSFHGKSG